MKASKGSDKEVCCSIGVVLISDKSSEFLKFFKNFWSNNWEVAKSLNIC